MEINKIFQIALEREASDIHLLKGEKPYLRMDGELVNLSELDVVENKFIENFVFSTIEKDQKKLLEEKRGLDFAYQTKDGARFRVHVHFERGNIALAARVIPLRIPSMEDLELPWVLKDMTRLKAGLVLITGSTGSGKSTTLASMIQMINKKYRSNIITLEDPIEFVYENEKSLIRQRELGSDIPNFAEGLRQALRSDPNVILVGELRDLETISVAMTVAETGHLVLGTLHTYSAAQTVDRIIDVFPPHQQTQVRLQLSMVLKGVVSQKLLPKIGGGRKMFAEVLLNTPAVGNLIRENKVAQINHIIQTNDKIGMNTMDQALQRAFEQEVISRETALSHMEDPYLLF